MHNSYDIPATSEWNTIPLQDQTFYSLSWVSDSFKLLKSPYRTDCRDYRISSQYLSRRDCIRKCKLNASLDKCGAIHEDIDLKRDEPPVLFGGQNIEKCIEQIDFEAICHKECRHHDCVINFYQPVIVSSYDHDENQIPIPITTVEFVFPVKPETAYYHEPKLATIEFICYLASTFSMWFGVSIYSLYYLFNMCLFNDEMRKQIFKHIRLSNDKRKVTRKIFLYSQIFTTSPIKVYN